jgi:hypothetical protein
MADSYIDQNLQQWQKSNVAQSLEGFQQHTAELKARREAYEQQKKEREHRPSRKQAMKFDDLRNAADQAQLDQKASEKVDGAKQLFKLDQREV